jgi:phosphoglucosamine mutase
MIEYALTAGICSMGVDVLLVGPLPTPGIAFITNSMRADAGIVISASHNPHEYNGIKIFAGDGYKLPDDTEKYLEDLISSGEIERLPRPAAAEIGGAKRIDDALGRYIVYLKTTFPRSLSLEGLRLVIDCAHGAAYRAAPKVFEELGAQVIVTGDRPDGRNINLGCGALHPGQMADLVRMHGADAGFALDGDADRVVFADERGEVLDGDELMAICATHFIKNNTLNGNTLVATVMSNLGLELTIRRQGGQMLRTTVGDRYVVEQMRQGDYNLGGEQSGHLIFLDYSTTGDGVLSAIQVLSVMLREEKPLSELKQVMEHYPQTLINVPVEQRRAIEEIPALVNLKESLENRLGTEGRLLIRPSGTEPVMRVMVEGLDGDLIKAVAEEMAHSIQKHMTVG